jgi:hypothetical protein
VSFWESKRLVGELDWSNECGRLAGGVTHAYSRQMWHSIVNSWPPLTLWTTSDLDLYGSDSGFVMILWTCIASWDWDWCWFWSCNWTVGWIG